MNLPFLRKRLLLFLPIVGLAAWIGTRDQADPLWLQAGEIVRQRYPLLEDVPDSLQYWYCLWHRRRYRKGDSTALRIVSQPTLSKIEWRTFHQLCDYATRHRDIVVMGVTGVGSTKQTKHLARLLTGSPDNQLIIECAPQFDLDFHKKYIGYERNGQFYPGELIQFWERCRRSPEQQFAVVIDNFDKINPETFFGPALWEALSSTSVREANIGGYRVVVPDNCRLLSVIHFGPGGVVKFSGEHFKRLGRPYLLRPNPRELCEMLYRKWAYSKDAARAAFVRDPQRMQAHIFYFLKANELIAQRYGEGYQLGQGTAVRELFLEQERDDLKRVFLDHLAAVNTSNPLTARDFASIEYTIEKGGTAPHSSFFDRLYQLLHDTGYFVEITMVITTALLTFLLSWWVFRRRERLIRHYGEQAQEIFQNFEQQRLNADSAAKQLERIKSEVDMLVRRRRLNYTEGLYLLTFIEDKVKRVEFARNVSQNFIELFNAFMEDNILTRSEYLKLRQFLQFVRHKIPPDTYEYFHRKVEDAYSERLTE
ncbi:MAG: hypothetical protein NZM43_06140 [Saprospiraceae bacterium]|nr:hypothetical protein [Saprospiraceae bacterium]MDW8483890.1 hypothetical protein [Saprospiraceae bacterium]